MRVTTTVRMPAGTTAPHRRGAVAVVVVVALVAVMSAAAFAVDAGDGWQARRQLQTASDAGALAGAARLSQGRTDACAEAAAVAALNADGAVVESCAASGDTVALALTRQVPLTFSAVMGRDHAVVHAGTTARSGNPSAASGLRPLALCEKAVAISQWLATGPTPVSADLTVPYTKSSPGDCGANAPGNWGVLDFDGGSNSNAQTNEWLLDGYRPLVPLGQRVPGNTGALSTSLDTPLQQLRDTGEVFQLPLYDQVQGTGSNATFRVSGFVSVKLVAYRLTGTAAQRSLTIRFLRRSIPGTGGGTVASPGVVVSAICAYREVGRCS